MSIEELLKNLKISEIGTYTDDKTYIVELKNSDAYGRINSRLDKSNLLDYIYESSFVEMENANQDYQYEDEYMLSLIADFDEDNYKLVIRELK